MRFLAEFERAMSRQQKITLGEMRSFGGSCRLLVCCGDSMCAHSVLIDAGRWGFRLSDLEPKFTCQACGHRGAETKSPAFGRANRK